MTKTPKHAEFESIFRRVRRELWIVTAADGSRRGGLLATWVAKTSIDPQSPTVATAISVNHFTRELIDSGGGFALHLIGPAQSPLAWKFCLESGRDRDKLDGWSFHVGATGSPILDDCLAWLDCKVYDRYDGGDRIYYWADVVAAEQISNEAPLTDHDLIQAATSEQRAQLDASIKANLAVVRPLFDAWRERLPE